MATPGQFNQPHGLAVDSKGNVYVADSAKHQVLVFGPDGALLREIGGLGSAPGQFNEPHGLAVDKDDNLYVADTWNARIDKFDPNGVFLKSWGQGQPDQSGRLLTMTDGTEAGNAAAPLGFYGPRGVAVDDQGSVYVADTGNKRVVVTDAEGNFKYQFGYAGAGLGQFNEPIGLALDGQGNLYVGDTWNGRIQVFGRDQQGQVSSIPIVTWNVSGWQASTYYDPFVAASPSGQVYLTVPGRDSVALRQPARRCAVALGRQGQRQRLGDAAQRRGRRRRRRDLCGGLWRGAGAEVQAAECGRPADRAVSDDCTGIHVTKERRAPYR